MELKVISDCKTCWNTLERMIERVLELKNPIQNSLRQLKLGNLRKEKYYEIVRDMLNCLKPCPSAVEALSNRDANLLTSKEFLSFCLAILKKRNLL
jgi:hypothetical protein